MSNNPHHPLPQYVVIEDGCARWATRDEVHECRCLTRRLLRSMCDSRQPSWVEPDTFRYRVLKAFHNAPYSPRAAAALRTLTRDVAAKDRR